MLRRFAGAERHAREDMYIVTGGAGLIGSALIWKLNSQGIDQVLVVDRLGTTDQWKNLISLSFTEFVHKDDFLALLESNSLPRKPTAIVHLGACSSTTEQNADYLMSNNYHYTRRLAEWSLSHKVRFVYASSAATYGDGSQGYGDDDATTLRLRPLNMYGYSKQLFDLWALRNGALETLVGLKFFNVFGPNEYHKGNMASVVLKAYRQVCASGRVKLFKSDRGRYAHGEQQRDFVYVKDCAEVIWWFLEHPSVAGLFNLGTGTARSWNDLARSVFAAVDDPPQIEYVDMPNALRGRYQNFTRAEMSKLVAAGCKMKFCSLEDAIRDYVVEYLQTDHPYLRWQQTRGN